MVPFDLRPTIDPDLFHSFLFTLLSFFALSILFTLWNGREINHALITGHLNNLTAKKTSKIHK